MSTHSFLLLPSPSQPGGIGSNLDHVNTLKLSYCRSPPATPSPEWPSHKANRSVPSSCLNLSTEHRIQTPTQLHSFILLSQALFPLTDWSCSSVPGFLFPEIGQVPLSQGFRALFLWKLFSLHMATFPSFGSLLRWQLLGERIPGHPFCLNSSPIAVFYPSAFSISLLALLTAWK